MSLSQDVKRTGEAGEYKEMTVETHRYRPPICTNDLHTLM